MRPACKITLVLVISTPAINSREFCEVALRFIKQYLKVRLTQLCSDGPLQFCILPKHEHRIRH